MSKRVVHCATTHRVGDPRVFWKECRTMAAAGYDVVYIVPHKQDEVREGVQIRAVPLPDTGRERLTKTVRAVFTRAQEECPDAVIHIHDSDLLLAGFLLKLRGRRVVYDSHEDTPKQMRYQHWIPRFARPIASFAASVTERVAGRVFDGIIAAEPENARRFPADKTSLVRNFPIVDELVAPGATPYPERPPRIVYIGALTVVRGLREMVQAIEIVRRTTEAELTLGGPFHPTNLREEVVDREGIENLGYLSRGEVAQCLAEARVGLVLFHPFKKHMECYPTKLFEYMAAGVPVVASDFPVWREIVEEAECGLVVDPLDPAAIAAAIETLLRDPGAAEQMGASGRAAVVSRYDWAGEGQELLRFYENLLGGDGQ